MAILDISEYDRLATDGMGHVVQTGIEPALASQQITALAAGNQQSAAFQEGTKIVRLHADIACRVKFGENPDASTGVAIRLAAGATEYFGVKRNSSSGPLKVAAVSTT